MECLPVFIDAENISCSDYNQTEQRIRNLGTIIVNNVYADWSDSSIKNWLINARKIGLHTIQCDKISGKNSIDLKITVDMMKYLFTNDHITTFIIVSTDSDFRHVVTEIKSLNKKVICVGYDYANISLKSVCDQYIELYELYHNTTDVHRVRHLQYGTSPTHGRLLSSHYPGGACGCRGKCGAIA